MAYGELFSGQSSRNETIGGVKYGGSREIVIFNLDDIKAYLYIDISNS